MKHLNHDERLDVMQFLDRSSMRHVDCLFQFVYRIVESRMRRALLPQFYGKHCLSVRPRNGVAMKNMKQRPNRPEELLELLQHVLRVSAADFVHTDGGALKRRAVCALHGAFQLLVVKAGRVGMLCVYNADFADAHTALFEVSNRSV